MRYAGKNKKKGSLQDIVFIAVALLVFSVVILIGFRVSSGLNDQIQNMSVMPTDAKAASSTLTNSFPGVIDNTFLFLTIGLALVAFALAALVRIHPIFIALFIIALLLIIFFCGIFSNIYQEMASNVQLTPYADQLTFISLIMNFLPFIVGIFGTILMIVMYKLGGEGG
jgi:heme/copper-type cytochrome/quinol oxidase subunit 3